MPFPPYFKNPLSDLVGTLLTHQDTRQCAEMEMKAINCLEAYGNVRGVNEKCTDLLKDYIECFQLKKQVSASVFSFLKIIITYSGNKSVLQESGNAFCNDREHSFCLGFSLYVQSLAIIIFSPHFILYIPVNIYIGKRIINHLSNWSDL